MKRIGMVIVAVLATACVLAQEKPRRGRGGAHPRGERPPAAERPPAGPMMHMAGAWVPRMLATKGNLAKIGVTDEALVAKLLGELKPLREQGDQLEQKVRENARAYAQLMRTLLMDKGSDPQAAMAKNDEVAKLRAEQGRLSVKALLVLRDNLSPEQLEKARAYILERGRERGRIRRGGPGQGPEAERKGPPEGGTPRAQPPDAGNQG